MAEPSTKHFTASGPGLDGGLHRLDRRRIGREAVVGQKPDVGREARLAFDGEGFRGDIALLDRARVGDEGRGVEAVGDALFLGKAVFADQPAVEGDEALVADDHLVEVATSSKLFAIAPGWVSRTCGSFWKSAATTTEGMPSFTALNGLSRLPPM
jgi:hypothetical protein